MQFEAVIATRYVHYLHYLHGLRVYEFEELNVNRISVTEMRMLSKMCGKIRKERIRNEDIRDNLA